MNKKIFYNSLIIFLFVIFIRLLPSGLELISADSCTYLDIARNISNGNGLYVSYNLYQFWPGEFYPALIYIPPIFPILLAIIWRLFHSIQAAVLLNVFICGLNCILFYLILDRIYKNAKIVFWAVILISVCEPMFLTSINIWTEQLHLLFLLIAIFVFLGKLSIKKSNMFSLGLILGISFFIKASIYNLLAFLIFITFSFGMNKKTLQALFYFISGFFIIVLPYQLLCVAKYHVLYPQYFKVNTVGYLKAIMVGGNYQAGRIPILKANEISLNFVVSFLFEMIPQWIAVASRMIFIDFGLLFYFLILRLLFPLYDEGDREINIKENLLITLALVNFIACTITIYWHPWFSLMEVSRFNLITYVLLIPPALAYLYNLLDRIGIKFKRYSSKVYYTALLFIFISMAGDAFSFNTDINLYRANSTEKNLQQKAFSWVRRNTRTYEIVATSEEQEGFELFRPTVSLPYGKILTESNMKDFLSIYKPSCILISNNSLSKYQDILSNLAEKISIEEDWNKRYSVYKLK